MSGAGRKTPSPHATTSAPEADDDRGTRGAPTVRPREAAAEFLRRVPRVTLSREELHAADLDHREYFLVTRMDGATTVEDLLDICGMPSEEALALIEGLVQRGIIGVLR
jgi:hypothetical protein